MAKKIYFSILFWIFTLTFNSLVAYNGVDPNTSSPLKAETCNAQPPENFRAISAGPQFVTLAWDPIWPGATHDLKVYKKNSNSNSWDPIDTIPNVSGSSFTYFNPDFDTTFAFSIATNCTNGEPSADVDFLNPPLGLIIDLILNGRIPTAPVSDPGNPLIYYQNFDWVGFKVEQVGGSASNSYNYFEFGFEEGRIKLKRTIYGPEIVAGNHVNSYPKDPNPLVVTIEDLSTVNIFKVQGIHNVLVIGKITLEHDLVNKTIKFFKTPNEFWNNNFAFSVVTSSLSPIKLDETDREIIKLSEVENIVIQNPFNEALKIFNLGANSYDGGLLQLKLISMDGVVVFDQYVDSKLEEISIPLAQLVPGIYTLNVRTQNSTTSFKVLKSN